MAVAVPVLIAKAIVFVPFVVLLDCCMYALAFELAAYPYTFPLVCNAVTAVNVASTAGAAVSAAD